MKTKVQFQTIGENYVHGIQATLGNRRAEVIRSYPSEWHVYYYIDGKQVTLGYNTQPTSYLSAQYRAQVFLTDETINETKQS
jgi:hypothetical protein